ncbi:MAG: hypothetical protein V2B15_08610 [Bacteroidota bacterium]
MAATDLFSSAKEIRNYVPVIEAAKQMGELEFAFREPEAKLKDLLGIETYDQIKAHYQGGTTVAILDDAVKYLQGSLANLAAVVFYVMDASDRNREEKKVYKYQEDQQKGIFLDNASAELGQLLSLLDANTTTFTHWAQTALYTTRQAQIITSHRDFGKYYYIDGSAYFFSRLVFLMKEITEDKILPVIGSYADLDQEDYAKIVNQVKKTLAYLTMAMALRRFDFVELPKTIRNNVSDNQSRTIRTGGQEGEAIRRVSEEIEGKGIIYLEVLQRMIEKKTTGTLEEPEEINDEDNQFYLQI